MAAAEAKKAYSDRVSGKRKDGIHATIPELPTAVKRFEVAKRAELGVGQTELRYIKAACDAEVREIHRHDRRVEQHPPRGGPGQQAIPNAIKAMPVTRATGMAVPESSTPNNNQPTSAGIISNADPVAASATAARMSTFFVVLIV
jgi:hypothetical protein